MYFLQVVNRTLDSHKYDVNIVLCKKSVITIIYYYRYISETFHDGERFNALV